MRYLSVCSGIEAATCAWAPLGWQAIVFAEIDKFPSALLAHRYPDVPNWGDITKFKEWPDASFDVLVGGTPCQSFSIAGLRAGLADPRGNLALVYLAIADRYRPEWLVWENVPGVRSVNGGRDFGAFLGGLGQLGYGWAYRSLDAQYFGLAQRRERVFVVAHLGDWRRAAAVLFEPDCLQGNPAPRREAGQGVAPTIARRPTGGGGLGTDFDCDGGLIADTLRGHPPPGSNTVGAIAMALNAHGGAGRMDAESETFVTHALRGEGFDASEDGTGMGTPLVAFSSKDHGADAGEIAPTLRAMGHGGSHASGGGQVAVAFTPETMYGVSHADAAQTGPDKALRALRNAVGKEAFSEWGLGIAAALRSQEVLRSDVHGQGHRRPTGENQLGLDDRALPRQEADPAWTVQRVWEVARLGRAPRRWQPSEQLARELGSHLSELPYQTPSTARLLLGLWRASEGLGLLRQALSTLQAARRPAGGQDQPAPPHSQVRRLTPREAERLQGFSDDYTLVPYRGKPAADGFRYKALGNSMAVPVVRWIGERIAHVAALRETA